MKMKTLRACDLDSLCSCNDPVWVVNTTGCLILIDLQSPNVLRLPADKAPVCLNNYFSTECLKQSHALRRLISDGRLQLIDPFSNPSLKKMKGTITSVPIQGNEEPREPEKICIVNESIDMVIAPSQMRDLANIFADIADGAEVSKSFPISVVEKWSTLASYAFPSSPQECAKIAASMLYGEAEVASPDISKKISTLMSEKRTRRGVGQGLK